MKKKKDLESLICEDQRKAYEEMGKLLLQGLLDGFGMGEKDDSEDYI